MSDLLISGQVKKVRWKSGELIKAEDLHLLNIFPMEVWLMIFDNITDQETLFNLSQETHLWGQVLHSRRSEYAYSQVLEVLVTHDYLSHDLLVQCRLLSENIKTLVNKQLEEGPHDADYGQFEKYGRQLRRGIALPNFFRLFQPPKFNLVESAWLYGICPTENLRQYNDLLHSPSPSNIFPGRRLDIDDWKLIFSSEFRSENRENFLLHQRAITIYFLKTVGHHFWHARIKVQNLADVNSWYNLICDNVKLMPNLKFLYVDYTFSEQCRSQSRSFPTINSLQLLALNNVPNWAVKAMLQANPKVKVVTLTGIRNQEPKSFNWSPFNSINFLSGFFGSPSEDFHLPQIQGLRTFRLEFGGDRKNESFQKFVNWSTIFGELESYGETLTELCLYLPRSTQPSHKEDIWSCSMNTLKMPNVKILELSVGDICSLDFLLGLESLEYLRLHLEYHQVPSPVKDTIVNFNHSSPHFSPECNIWRLVPSLKEIYLTTRFQGDVTSSTRKYVCTTS